MLSVNTNISSLITQQNLKTSTNKLNLAIERMTTGYKINSAADNAANHSICVNMSTQIGAYDIAEENAMIGLDLITTGYDTLTLLSNTLVRLRALAEQAANGTYSKQSLQAMNKEAAALINEMYRTKNNAQNIFGSSVIDEGIVGAHLEVKDTGFLQDIATRDISSMTRLADVDASKTLAQGTYSISSAEELAKLATMQNSGKITTGSEFVLGADIDLSAYSSGEGWVAIGTYSQRFQCTFDGNGHKISNLYMKRAASCQGFFGAIFNAEIKNLGIDSGMISGGTQNVGALAAWAYGTSTVKNCFSNVEIDMDPAIEINAFGSQVGGLIGFFQYGTIDYCYTTGNVTSMSDCGGLVGASNVNLNISNCFTTGNIESTTSGAGGLCCMYAGNITNCYTTGNVITKGASNDAGGLIGRCGNSGTTAITNCHTTGNIKSDHAAGGIIGNNGGCIVNITNCYTTGIMDCGRNVGGIAAVLDLGGNITNCHTTATIKHGSCAGAIVGYDIESSTIKDCSYVSDLDPLGNNAATLENVVDASLGVNYNLQIGINGDNTSQINTNNFFTLGGLKDLLDKGIQSKDALKTIDNLTNKISTIQVGIGASQNRLESALEEIAIKKENLLSSRSTLKGVDIAKVSSEYIKQQILQQASATLLATANQNPAIALQLL